MQRRLMVRALAVMLLGSLATVAFVWCLFVGPRAFEDAPYATIVERSMTGEMFGAQARKVIPIGAVDRAGGKGCRELRARAELFLRIQLADAAMAGDRLDDIDAGLGAVERAAREVLACAPSDGFAWLALYWTNGNLNGFGPETARFLEMSYRMAPHELWLAYRRNRLAVRAISGLSPDTQERVIGEWANLVRAWLSSTAIASFSAAEPATRDRLIAAGRALGDPVWQPMAARLDRLGIDTGAINERRSGAWR